MRIVVNAARRANGVKIAERLHKKLMNEEMEEKINKQKKRGIRNKIMSKNVSHSEQKKIIHISKVREADVQFTS
jgi:hypothetical protein